MAGYGTPKRLRLRALPRGRDRPFGQGEAGKPDNHLHGPGRRRQAERPSFANPTYSAPGGILKILYNVMPLTFNHALTAVKFVCGDDMQGGTVKSVSLKNVYSKGNLTFAYSIITQSCWSDVDTPADFSQTLGKTTTGTPDEAPYYRCADLHDDSADASRRRTN
ncbi:hypothetical protein NXW78_28055 [Bacteroides ovatus]|nr:hypothetical protein [Bacteroides ovatus]